MQWRCLPFEGCAWRTEPAFQNWACFQNWAQAAYPPWRGFEAAL